MTGINSALYHNLQQTGGSIHWDDMKLVIMGRYNREKHTEDCEEKILKTIRQLNPKSLSSQQLKGLHHSAIYTRNITESIRYYSEVLGLEEAFRLKREDGTLSTIYLIIAPGQYLEIFCERTVGKKRLRFSNWVQFMFQKLFGYSGICHICFATEDIQRAYDTILASGGPVDSEIERGQSQCLKFWTHDPDGNRIEIMETPPESMQAQADRRFVDQG